MSPANGVLEVNESLQVTVEFQPQVSGDHQAQLVLHYDTGKIYPLILWNSGNPSARQISANSAQHCGFTISSLYFYVKRECSHYSPSLVWVHPPSAALSGLHLHSPLWPFVLLLPPPPLRCLQSTEVLCGSSILSILVSGEDVYVSLYGAAQDANVRLDKNSIRVENTYISMANQRTVTISNRSDVIVHYKWSQFATQEEEDQQKLLYVTKFLGSGHVSCTVLLARLARLLWELLAELFLVRAITTAAPPPLQLPS